MLKEKGGAFWLERYKRIPSYRRYWNQPNLIRTDKKLSKEQRRKVLEKFFELVDESKEENEKRNSKIMRERNKEWAFLSK